MKEQKFGQKFSSLTKLIAVMITMMILFMETPLYAARQHVVFNRSELRQLIPIIANNLQGKEVYSELRHIDAESVHDHFMSGDLESWGETQDADADWSRLNTELRAHSPPQGTTTVGMARPWPTPRPDSYTPEYVDAAMLVPIIFRRLQMLQLDEQAQADWTRGVLEVIRHVQGRLNEKIAIPSRVIGIAPADIQAIYLWHGQVLEPSSMRRNENDERDIDLLFVVKGDSELYEKEAIIREGNPQQRPIQVTAIGEEYLLAAEDDQSVYTKVDLWQAIPIFGADYLEGQTPSDWNILFFLEAQLGVALRDLYPKIEDEQSPAFSAMLHRFEIVKLLWNYLEIESRHPIKNSLDFVTAMIGQYDSDYLASMVFGPEFINVAWDQIAMRTRMAIIQDFLGQLSPDSAPPTPQSEMRAMDRENYLELLQTAERQLVSVGSPGHEIVGRVVRNDTELMVSVLYAEEGRLTPLQLKIMPRLKSITIRANVDMLSRSDDFPLEQLGFPKEILAGFEVEKLNFRIEKDIKITDDWTEVRARVLPTLRNVRTRIWQHLKPEMHARHSLTNEEFLSLGEEIGRFPVPTYKEIRQFNESHNDAGLSRDGVPLGMLQLNEAFLAWYRGLINDMGRNLRILSLGAGRGQLEAKLIEDGHQVTAIDASPKNVSFAKKVGVDAHAGNAHKLLEPVTRYDLVIMIDAIGQMDPRVIFKVVAKQLKPGGEILVTTPRMKESMTEEDYRFTKYIQYKQRLLDHELEAAGFELGDHGHTAYLTTASEILYLNYRRANLPQSEVRQLENDLLAIPKKKGALLMSANQLGQMGQELRDELLVTLMSRSELRLVLIQDSAELDFESVKLRDRLVALPNVVAISGNRDVALSRHVFPKGGVVELLAEDQPVIMLSEARHENRRLEHVRLKEGNIMMAGLLATVPPDQIWWIQESPDGSSEMVAGMRAEIRRFMAEQAVAWSA